MAHTHRRFLVVVVIWKCSVVEASGARNFGKDHERQAEDSLLIRSLLKRSSKLPSVGNHSWDLVNKLGRHAIPQSSRAPISDLRFASSPPTPGADIGE